MKHVNVDTAPPAVKKFMRSLAIDANGVAVTVGGNIVCKIIPPDQLSDAEKTARLADARRLLDKARANSKRFPAKDVERRIRDALKTVRGRR